MTLIIPEGDDGAAEDFILGVEEHFEHAAEVFKAAANKIAKGELVAAAKAKDLAHEYRKVATVCYEERKRLAEKRKNQAGVVHEYALDFDAARVEIRSRLARLRTARDSGDVSE